MSASHRTLRVFEQALELDAPQRAACLDDAGAQDAALRADVDALLAADAAAGTFLAAPLAASGRSGERLGVWRLTHLLGSGGMGSVYRAARADAAFAKPVAIKLLLFDAGNLRARRSSWRSCT